MFDYDDYNPVRSVGERKALAAKLAKQYAEETGRDLHPVTANGRLIAKSFWGKAWCRNIESYQDYESRLPRGRSYLKNGAVIDLNIEPGLVTAAVAGSELYQVKIAIDPLDEERWETIKRACAGKIGSLIDLVQGKLSDEIIGILCAPDTGLFPLPDEIHLDCNCPDWADLCKHLAAVLYGIGAKLDEDPGLFFVLRGVDRNELFESDLAAALPPEAADLDAAALGDAFGIDLDTL